jgi:hypothetical protein
MDWDRVYTDGPKPPDPPAPTLLRMLWTMTQPGKKPIPAAIYQTAVGRELRVHIGADADNLIDSLLSRTNDVPLEARASELRAVLLEQGWAPEDFA